MACRDPAATWRMYLQVISSDKTMDSDLDSWASVLQDKESFQQMCVLERSAEPFRHLGGKSSCRALLRLGQYWMYLVYPTYSPVYSAQLSASTKRLKLERRGNWPCSPEACWVSSSLTPDKHPPHGWARPHARQFFCLSSCHWISL